MNQGWNLGEWRMAIFQGLKKSEELYEMVIAYLVWVLCAMVCQS
jgi:hypothetical protein